MFKPLGILSHAFLNLSWKKNVTYSLWDTFLKYSNLKILWEQSNKSHIRSLVINIAGRIDFLIFSRFLDRNAFIYGLLVPSTIFISVTLYYLVRSALVARYVISMQVDRKLRDKMRRKRMLHIALFAKVRNNNDRFHYKYALYVIYCWHGCRRNMGNVIKVTARVIVNVQSDNALQFIFFIYYSANTLHLT